MGAPIEATEPSGTELVQQHIGRLSNEAATIKSQIEKLEAEHKQNREKIVVTDKHYAKIRFEEDRLHGLMQQVWKERDSAKIKQRNLLRKQQAIEADRAAKWEDYKLKSALVSELHNAVNHGLYGSNKRSTSSTSIQQVGNKKARLNNKAWDDESDITSVSSGDEAEMEGPAKKGEGAKETGHEVKSEVKAEGDVKDEIESSEDELEVIKPTLK